MSSDTHPSLGVRAFLADIVDYAGLFPPAELPLDDAVQNYIEYRNGPHSWMLGRFVIPANRLEELGGHDAFFMTPLSARLSVLLRSGETATSFVTAVKESLGLIASFSDEHAGRVRIESLEVPWPASVSTREDIDLVLTDVHEVVSHVLGGDVTTFLETSWKSENARLLTDLAAGIAEAGATPRTFGLKVRTGGPTSDFVPGVEDLARFIATAHQAGVSFKATAGLHHPARNHDEALDTTVFGFMNVFVAATLFHSGAISEEIMREVLAEADPRVFVFDNGVAWRNTHIGSESILRGRSFALSFGSCSFEEPVADLQHIGLL